MEYKKAVRFDTAINILTSRIRYILQQLPDEIKEETQEIRLRTNLPVMLVGSYGKRFINSNAKLSYLNSGNIVVASLGEVNDTFNRLCGYSLHSNQSKIREGYITIDGGHRVGFCGSAVLNSKEISTIKDISSLNLRIAGQHFGAANEIMSSLYCDGLKSIIIAGPPLSGKTTVLRDLARQISSSMSEYYNVSVIDERGEIAAVSKGTTENDLGLCCDVLSGYPKGEGIICSLRSMAPDVIICDEIGSMEEVRRIETGLNSGVKFIVSIHAESKSDLFTRPQAVKLIETGEFENAVLLRGKEFPGQIKEILKAGELKDEIYRNSHTCGAQHCSRTYLQYEDCTQNG